VTSRTRELLRDKEHLVVLTGLFFLALLVFLGLRALLVPADFGVYGHFRRSALDENQARPLVYAGREVCQTCHVDEAAKLKTGKHAGVGCEACHGALGAHAEDPSTAQARRPAGRDFCLGCHAANVAKPHKFPQIQAKGHADGPCVTCHTPHSPQIEKGAAS
jgi:hypothetical protein